MTSDQPGDPAQEPVLPRSDPAAEQTSVVSTLELFFDLVFVFTITQLTAVVDHHPGPIAVAQASLTLIVLFWMYAGFTWLTNVTGAAGVGRRLTVLAAMAALFICSLAVPEAFGTDGLVFGIAFLVLTLIHVIGFRLFGDEAGRRAIIRIAPVNIGAALLILLAGFTDSNWDWLLWGLAAAVYLAALLGRRASRGFTIHSDHFAERHGLMILIVLGESLISVGVAASGQQLTGRLVIGALCGFVCIAALWWAYFVGDDEAAAQRMAELDESSKARFALWGYDLTHLLMIAGIIGVAAGTRLGLPDLLLPAEQPGAILIAAGSALYLLGTAWFRSAFHFAPAGPRLVGAAGCLLTMFVGTGWGTGQQLAAVAVVVAAATAAPGLLHRRRSQSAAR
ncbi:MAG: low temperature requirement protein A [Nakamurella sp.]